MPSQRYATKSHSNLTLRFLFTFLITLATIPIFYAQLDSLQNLIYSNEGFAHDTVEINTRHEYAIELYYASEDSMDAAINQLDKAYALAEINNLIIKQIAAYNLKGILLRIQEEYDSALVTYDGIIDLAMSNKLELRAGQMIDNKSSVYVRMHKRDLALDLKFKALDIFKKHADSTSLVICYSGISGLYLETGEFQKCIDFGHLSVANDPNPLTSDNRAYISGNLALAHKRLNQPDSALYYFLECQELSKNIKHLYRDNQSELAKFYFTQKKYENAITIFKELIDPYPIESKSSSLHRYRLQLAQSQQEIGKYKEAAKALGAIDTSVISKNHRNLMIYYKVASRLNYESGKYKLARDQFRLFRNYKDSLNIVETKSNFKEIEEKYNVAEKEKVIATQSVQLRNRMLSIISLLSLLGIGTLLFLLRQRKLKFAKAIADQKNLAQIAEIKNLRKENKIISMQAMLSGQEEERKRIAQDLHDNIGSLMSTIKIKVLDIQNKIKGIEKMNIGGELDSMINRASQEIRRISHRMTPVAMELSGLEGAVMDLGQQLDNHNIKLTLDVDQLEQVTNKTLSINIYRIIQEIVNNTIKHSQASEMTISADIKDDTINLIISDNGIGFDPSIIQKNKSIGLSGIQSRVTYLNGAIEINSINQTEYKISIPMNPEV